MFGLEFPAWCASFVARAITIDYGPVVYGPVWSAEAAERSGAVAFGFLDTIPGFSSAVRSVTDFVGRSFGTHPELLMALAVLSLFPLLILLGALIPRRRRALPASVQPAAPQTQLPIAASRSEYWLKTRDGQSACVNRRVVTIGADPGCSIVIDGPGVADLHALVSLEEAGCRVVRLADPSSVAVYIGNERVDVADLSGGEKIRIGANIVSFDACCHGLDELPVHPKSSYPLGQKIRKTAGDGAWQAATDNGSSGAEARF